MGYHVYKTNRTPVAGEKLTDVMESNNLMDKYAVAVKRSDESIVGHLPLGKSEKFAKAIFHFIKANKKHSCVIKVLGKAINGGDGLGMKVPGRLLFFAEEKYINEKYIFRSFHRSFLCVFSTLTRCSWELQTYEQRPCEECLSQAL